MQPTSGTLDPVLTLLAPDGQPVAFDDDAGGERSALISGVQLPSDGVYGVQAWGSGLPGTYELTLATAPAGVPRHARRRWHGRAPRHAAHRAAGRCSRPTVGPRCRGRPPVRNHVPVSESIERPGAFDRFVIPVDAGATYTIGLRPLS